MNILFIYLFIYLSFELFQIVLKDLAARLTAIRSLIVLYLTTKANTMAISTVIIYIKFIKIFD